MGILQKQSPYAHISYILSKLDGRACILSYVIGLAWFLALAHHKLNAPTYFSENALLPGLVESEFYSDYGAEGYNKELKQLLIDQENTDKMYEIPTGWLTQKFRSLGIDTYVQKYSFRYPFGIYQGRNLTGQNVYGIMRAPRSPGTEALVLSVPFRPELSKEQATYPGVALMLALAKAFRRHSYWAKDVVFLVTDNEEIGIQAWLSSYHHAPNRYISAEVLPSRSGSIQAAINLEMPFANIGRVNVKFEGLNGKLPNLDLINTVERLFVREGLKITIQEKSRELGINEWSRYLHSLKTMLSMIWHQAPGTPTGNHGYFHKYNIEAVTIQGMKGKVKKSFEFSDTGRVLEGIFRSLNNLLERFHQSFFFYLLPSPNRYVSIGVYMPPFGVMVLPIVIKALASWISLSGDPTADKKKKEKEETERQSKSIEQDVRTEIAEQESKEESNPCPDGPASPIVPDDEPKSIEDNVPTEVIEQDSKESKNSFPYEPVSTVIPDDENQKGLDKLYHVIVFIISLFTGVGSFYAADFFVESAHKFYLTQEEGLAIGFLVIHVLAMLQPFIFKRHVLKGLNGTLKLDRNFLNCFTLLFFGISIGTISVMNISMAFLVAAAWVPVIFINQATHFRLLVVLKYLAIICVSPFSLLFIGCIVNQVLAGFNDNVIVLLGKAWMDLQDGLMLSAFQFYLSDNWTFPLLNFVFLPIWSLFWFIATVND